MLQSSGALIKSVVLQNFTPASWNGWPQPGISLAFRSGSYASMYRRQLWVNVVVSKRARALARLPLKVYERGSRGRAEASDSSYAELLRNPSPNISSFEFWLWASSTFDLYGEVFLGKIRDRGGRVTELMPLHPLAMTRNDNGTWTYDTGVVRFNDLARRDLIIHKDYNPEDSIRGLSRLEPLRQTLENEAAARAAISSFWTNGARPGIALVHPNRLSKQAADRLKVEFDSLNAGAENTGKTVVLEEGMKPEILQITAEQAQYIETRKLNREEVCGAYDVPPPVVHILDHATFSNITEQMRSMYRDTMAPHLKGFESALETQLRELDFGDDIYAEFLMDEVLRGDFEVRADAYQKAINSSWMTPAEVRELENLPFIEGSDELLANGTLTPLDERTQAQDQAALPPQPPPAQLPPEDVRTVLGRLSRTKELSDIDPESLCAELKNPELVTEELILAQAADATVSEFRARIAELSKRGNNEQ